MSGGFEQFRPDGPIPSAGAWLARVLDDADLRGAWLITAPEFRRAMVEGWLDANADHPLVAAHEPDTALAELTEDCPAHPLWDGFEATQLRHFAILWADVDLETWGWGSDPRPFGPGEEVVILFECDDESFTVEEDTPMRGIALVMRHAPGQAPVGDWVVAGIAPPGATS